MLQKQTCYWITTPHHQHSSPGRTSQPTTTRQCSSSSGHPGNHYDKPSQQSCGLLRTSHTRPSTGIILDYTPTHELIRPRNTIAVDHCPNTGHNFSPITIMLDVPTTCVIRTTPHPLIDEGPSNMHETFMETLTLSSPLTLSMPENLKKSILSKYQRPWRLHHSTSGWIHYQSLKNILFF